MLCTAIENNGDCYHASSFIYSYSPTFYYTVTYELKM